MADFYANNADIYAAINLPSLSGQLAALRSVVPEPFPGPVVDVAAGLGTALPALADRTSDPLFAVEPSSHMRVGLMTTVAGCEALRQRVTVLPGTLRQIQGHLPDQLGGVVVLSAIGHFATSELEHFWSFVGRRLVPGGRLVLGLQPPLAPVAIPWADFGEAKVGQRLYRTAGGASITADGQARWTVRWTIHDADGVELERREASTQWAIVGPAHIAEAANAVGLVASAQNLDWNMFSFCKPR